jgi:hypothetical protein
MGGKVSGHTLHSRLTRRSIWQDFRNTGVEPCPPGSPRRVSRVQVGGWPLRVLGRGGTAIDEPAWRLRRAHPTVASIAAGLQLCSAPPRQPAFGPRPMMHLPDPGRPFGSRDDRFESLPLSQTNILLLLNYYILGCGPKKGALPGALRAPAIAAVQARAARRRLSARQDRNISVGH